MKHVGVTADPKDIATQEQLAPNAFTDLGDVSGAVVLDLGVSRAFKMNLTDNLTLSFSGESPAGIFSEVALWFRGNGHGVTWPTEVKWPKNVPPVLWADAEDLFGLCTGDGGATYSGRVESARFALRGGPVYRYWRIRVTAQGAPAGGWTGVSELELRATVGGPDLTTVDTPVTTTNNYGAPEKLVDGNTNVSDQGWRGDLLPYDIVVDLGEGASVSELAMWPYSEYGYFPAGPMDFTVSGSYDGAEFTLVSTFTDRAFAAASVQTYSLV